jgi:hypothetical protein
MFGNCVSRIDPSVLPRITRALGLKIRPGSTRDAGVADRDHEPKGRKEGRRKPN